MHVRTTKLSQQHILLYKYLYVHFRNVYAICKCTAINDKNKLKTQNTYGKLEYHIFIESNKHLTISKFQHVIKQV